MSIIIITIIIHIQRQLWVVLTRFPKFTKTIKGNKESIEVPSTSIIIIIIQSSYESEQEHFQMNTSFCQKEYEWMDR
jgi:hypothetical protein